MPRIKKKIKFPILLLSSIFLGPLSLHGQFFLPHSQLKTPHCIARSAEKLHDVANEKIKSLQEKFHKNPIKTSLKGTFLGYKGFKFLYITVPLALFPFIPRIAAKRLQMVQKYSTKIILNLANKYSINPKSFSYKTISLFDNYLSTEKASIENYAENGFFVKKNDILIEFNPIFDFENPAKKGGQYEQKPSWKIQIINSYKKESLKQYDV